MKQEAVSAPKSDAIDASQDILRKALSKRISGYSRDVFLYILIGLLSILAGAGIFWVIWVEFKDDATEIVAQFAGGATTLVTFGLSSVFAGKILSLRDEIRIGREWMEIYTDALGPPPDGLLEEIKKKILTWLET